MSRLSTALADRYRIERELGAGGMATVYLAQDLRHDRMVAIKVLKPELAAVIGAERFLREIKTIATLQHPHILGLIDSGEVQGTAYYVMPFVEGESLRDRLTREKQLPIADAVRLATEVAGALDYAHRHGVIHRDIKPENILLHDGSALVADFGIALAASKAGGTRMTETGMSLGTPHYMSPEQAMGEREITARSDVYALGCVTYEMLTGDPPFTGSTAQAIVAKVMTEKPAPLQRQRERVPDAVEDAVLTALEKLPADRFGSAKEFADALAGSGTTARMTSPRLRTRRLAPTLGAFAAGALLAGLTAWTLRPRPRAEDVVRFALALPQNVSPLPRTASGTTLTISPDGRLVVFVGDGSDGIQRLYARELDEAMPRVLGGTEGATQPFFSPDGRWVGFWADGKLQRLALDGRAPQPICDTPEPFGVTWAGGENIVLGSAGGLLIVRAGGGTPEPLVAADSGNRPHAETFPVALPGGDRVLYGSWGQGGLEDVRIAIVTLGSRTKHILDLPGIAPIGVAAGQLLFSRVDRSLWAVPFDPGTA
ncbi:MAG: protein kinase domain-containing protein, partial [Gemmatimonadales bacterium]